jgi:hypothetical protein
LRSWAAYPIRSTLREAKENAAPGSHRQRRGKQKRLAR